MPAIGPERFIFKKQLGALSATTEYCVWTNDLGETVELEAAQFNQLLAITANTNNFWTLDLYEYTAAGVQGDIVATLSYGTGEDNHVAFVAQDMALDSTGLSLGDGLSWTIKATPAGTCVNLSADAEVVIRVVKGMTSKA